MSRLQGEAMKHFSDQLSDYGFSTEVRVRLSETDAVGVVFFGTYAHYFDIGRMDYLAHLGLNKLDGAVRDLIPGVVVAHEAEFKSPARYNDVLTIFVRIAHIGRTSYTFHLNIVNKRTRAKVAQGSLSLVWMNEAQEPIPVPQGVREVISEFEGEALST